MEKVDQVTLKTARMFTLVYCSPHKQFEMHKGLKRGYVHLFRPYSQRHNLPTVQGLMRVDLKCCWQSANGYLCVQWGGHSFLHSNKGCFEAFRLVPSLKENFNKNCHMGNSKLISTRNWSSYELAHLVLIGKMTLYFSMCWPRRWAANLSILSSKSCL